MADFILAMLLCLGIHAPVRSASGDLLVLAVLGTPCLPAAHAQISLPRLQRAVVADSLGWATFPRVRAGELRIVVTHLGSTALHGTVYLDEGVQYVVLADLAAHELRAISMSSPDDR